MGDKIKLVIFQLALHKFALPISAVERIIQIVEISELPKSPEFLMGIINVHGEIVPVINPRVLFDLPLKEIELSDQLIIVKTANVKIALWVDVTNEVLDIPLEKYIDIKKIKYGNSYIDGIVKFPDSTLLINNPDKFLNKKNLEELFAVLKKAHKKIDLK